MRPPSVPTINLGEFEVVKMAIDSNCGDCPSIY